MDWLKGSYLFGLSLCGRWPVWKLLHLYAVNRAPPLFRISMLRHAHADIPGQANVQQVIRLVVKPVDEIGDLQS